MIQKRKRNKRCAILAHVPHAIVCPVAQISKKVVFHVELKSWLKPLGPTVPYLKNNFICFLRYSWLATPAFTTATFMFPSVWLAWLKWAFTWRSFHQIMTSLRCPQSDQLQCTLLTDICDTANHIVRDARKMSHDVHMPFGCCNCGLWIEMGTCAANSPVLQGKVPGWKVVTKGTLSSALLFTA